MKRLFTLLLLLAATPTLFSGDPAEDKKPEKLTEDAPVLIQMLRVKDPVTGKMRQPTPTELRLLMPTNPLDRTGKDLVEKKNKKGGTKLDLRGTMQSATIAKLGPDGKVVTSCVNSDKQFRDFVAAPVVSKKEATRDQ